MKNTLLLLQYMYKILVQFYHTVPIRKQNHIQQEKLRYNEIK